MKIGISKDEISNYYLPLLLLLNPWTNDLLLSLFDTISGDIGDSIWTGKGFVGNATIGNDNVGWWFAIIGVPPPPDAAVIIWLVLVFFLAAVKLLAVVDADGGFLIALRDVVVVVEDPDIVSVVADVEEEEESDVVVEWLWFDCGGDVIICLVFCSRLAKSLLVSGCGKLLNAKLGNEVTCRKYGEKTKSGKIFFCFI